MPRSQDGEIGLHRPCVRCAETRIARLAFAGALFVFLAELRNGLRGLIAFAVWEPLRLSFFNCWAHIQSISPKHSNAMQSDICVVACPTLSRSSDPPPQI